MENREFDRQEHNMGGQPDGPYRDNGPGPQDGNRNGAGRTGSGPGLWWEPL